MEFDPAALPIPDLGLNCIGCGYSLKGLPSHRCPECGREIDLEQHIPRGDFPAVILDGREVPLSARTNEIMRRAGILFMAAQNPAESIFGMSRTQSINGKLAVERNRYFDAIRWLKHFAATGEMPPEPDTSGSDWKCTACGEENPPTFEVCWNCDTVHNVDF
ncbi:MAG: hypothetical protein KF841_09230 [Phycisphaerae bacterium]|nr:hypothetical protein [Phycisphaerae bacterium]